MSLTEKAKPSDDFTDTETLDSALSQEIDLLKDVDARWHHEEGKQRSQDIDRYLEAESLKLQRQVKILVLGLNEPKDVFWKQTLLLATPLTDQDREEMKPAIRQTVFGLAKRVAEEVLYRIHWSENREPEAKAAVPRVREVLEHEDEESARRLDVLFADEKLHSDLARIKLDVEEVARGMFSDEYNLFKYYPGADQDDIFKTLLHRVLAPDYIPTDHDYKHFDHRRKHSYLREAQLHRDTHVLRVLDLHAGRGERKKWIHLFEDMRSVVFVADLSTYAPGTYDRGDREHASVSPLHEIMQLFESIARSRWFKDMPILCVLANVEAFKGKLKKWPLVNWFSSYTDRSNDEAVQFMVDRIMEAAKGREDVRVHVCDELNASAVQIVFDLIEGRFLKIS